MDILKKIRIWLTNIENDNLLQRQDKVYLSYWKGKDANIEVHIVQNNEKRNVKELLNNIKESAENVFNDNLTVNCNIHANYIILKIYPKERPI